MAVFLLHIADHFLSAIHAKVDVKVRHRHPFRIQEPFEQQRIAQRVKVGDGQRISHKAARTRPPARTNRDVIVFGPLDKVRNDQKVAGKPHTLDDAQFKIQPFLILLDRHRVRDHRQTFLQALICNAAQFGNLIIGKFRQDRIAPVRHKGTALGDLDGVFQRLGQIGEQHRHFLRCLEIMLRSQAAARLLLVDIGPFRDADHRVVRLIHLGLGEIDVVGRNQWQVHLIGHLDQAAL